MPAIRNSFSRTGLLNNVIGKPIRSISKVSVGIVKSWRSIRTNSETFKEPLPSTEISAKTVSSNFIFRVKRFIYKL